MHLNLFRDEQMENFSLLSSQLIIYWTMPPNNCVWCRWIWGHICILLLSEKENVFLQDWKRCFRNEERKAKNNLKKGRNMLQKIDLICIMSVQRLHDQKLYERSSRSPFRGEFWPGFFMWFLPGSWTTKANSHMFFMKFLCWNSSLLKNKFIACVLNTKNFRYSKTRLFKLALSNHSSITSPSNLCVFYLNHSIYNI